MILFLDLGTKTGWAISHDGAIVSHGMQNFAPGRMASAGVRFTKFRDFLSSHIGRDFQLERVIFEEVRRHRGTDAAHIYGGLLAVLQTFCLDQDIEYEGLPIGTIKKFVTGKGNAGKPEMIAAVQRQGFPRVKDENEADAIGVGLTWLSQRYTIDKFEQHRAAEEIGVIGQVDRKFNAQVPMNDLDDLLS